MSRALAAWLLSLPVLAACGSSRSSPPLYSTLATPPEVEPTPAEDCLDRYNCERSCGGGVADSCARLAEMVQPRDWRRAVALWMEACSNGASAACVRAMAVAPGKLADEHAARACSAGRTGACLLLGTVQLRRAAAAGWRSARTALSADAGALFRRACEAGDWSGCLQAGDRARALELATEACTGEPASAEACRLAAADRRRAGDDQTAAIYLARGCSALLASALDTADAAVLAHDSLCRDARALDRPVPVTAPPAPGMPRRVAPDRASSRLLSGITRIAPGARERRDLARGRAHAGVGLSLCISEVGLVDRITITRSSGLPSWELGILDQVRRWRFRPFLVDGQPTPICTHATFKADVATGAR